MMDERDLRFNRPLNAEWVRGETLYRQLRDRPLTYSPVPDGAFGRENTACDVRQAWTAPLTREEASAVACYGLREARWMDLLHSTVPVEPL